MLLRVPDAPGDHPCGHVESTDPAAADSLQLTAYTTGEYARGEVVRSGASLQLETPFERQGFTPYKLREGQVIGDCCGGRG